MDTDDGSWIFDSLICFLNGPVWNAPLQSFIEEKSLIFETNNDENPEYKKIYDEFKNLVDLMLGSYMEDIGITPEQFENACSKQYTNQLPLRFHQNLFEQIWAANDYEIFKRMMAQRNIELQLQALELIEKRYGIKPKSFIPQSCELDSARSSTPIQHTQESVVMNELIRECKQDEQNVENIKEEIKKIPDEYQIILQQDLENKKDLLRNAIETAISEVKTPEKEIETEEIKAEINVLPESKTLIKVDKEELQRRQNYLKAQRDKLVALKKQVREKQLKQDEITKERPKSAKIAEAAMAGITENESKVLDVRRALAERLRSEVVSHKEP